MASEKVGTKMASGKVVEVTDSTFEQTALKGDLPCLVDFWAAWCGPCKALKPIIHQLAEEVEGKLTIATMDVDGNPNTPGKFGIRAIPTLILFKNGQEVERITGLTTKDQLVKTINSKL